MCKKKYHLLRVETLVNFNKIVNDYIDHGWEPVGAAFYNEFGYHQTLVRRAYIKEGRVISEEGQG